MKLVLTNDFMIIVVFESKLVKYYRSTKKIYIKRSLIAYQYFNVTKNPSTRHFFYYVIIIIMGLYGSYSMTSIIDGLKSHVRE